MNKANCQAISPIIFNQSFQFEQQRLNEFICQTQWICLPDSLNSSASCTPRKTPLKLLLLDKHFSKCKSLHHVLNSLMRWQHSHCNNLGNMHCDTMHTKLNIFCRSNKSEHDKSVLVLFFPENTSHQMIMLSLTQRWARLVFFCWQWTSEMIRFATFTMEEQKGNTSVLTSFRWQKKIGHNNWELFQMSELKNCVIVDLKRFDVHNFCDCFLSDLRQVLDCPVSLSSKQERVFWVQLCLTSTKCWLLVTQQLEGCSCVDDLEEIVLESVGRITKLAGFCRWQKDFQMSKNTIEDVTKSCIQHSSVHWWCALRCVDGQCKPCCDDLFSLVWTTFLLTVQWQEMPCVCFGSALAHARENNFRGKNYKAMKDIWGRWASGVCQHWIACLPFECKEQIIVWRCQLVKDWRKKMWKWAGTVTDGTVPSLARGRL